MKFSNGYLGVFLIVISAVFAIAGAYALSMDVTEEEVIKYNEVAELTGLFETEPAPAYINYNPSTNQTGYYTDPDTKYFNGVDATTQTQPNQYRLNMEPLNLTTGTTGTLSGTDWTAHPTMPIMYYLLGEPINGTYWGSAVNNGTTVTLNSLINNLNVGPEIDLIKLMSIDGKEVADNSYSHRETIESNWILFSTINQWSTANNIYTHYSYSPGFYDSEYHGSGSGAYLIMLSAEIDLQTNAALLYYDNECKEFAGQFNLSDVLVTFGGTETGTGYNYADWILGTTANYEYSTTAERTYMDIRDGVELL